MDGSAPVVVALVSSAIEAELIAGMLRSNGLDAAVSTDDAGGNEPQFDLTHGVRVLVPAEDEARAKELISEADNA